MSLLSLTNYYNNHSGARTSHCNTKLNNEDIPIASGVCPAAPLIGDGSALVTGVEAPIQDDNET
jgi:hypothetical protein